MSQDSSPLFYFPGSDPEMARANERARATFRYFWRELAWERRRIVPGLDVAVVKIPFSDGDPETEDDVEHMWVEDVGFDGRNVTGVLLNQPNGLTSVKQNDVVRVPLSRVGDWLYAVGGEVYGGHTVNVMRSRMGPAERREHDQAWGLDFGDPRTTRLVYWNNQRGGLLRRWFGSRRDESPELGEHPMSLAMLHSLIEQVAADPSFISETDEEGWTLLHSMALAGAAPMVRVLLEAGANPRAKTNHGMTALQLARSLGWENVIALLT